MKSGRHCHQETWTAVAPAQQSGPVAHHHYMTRSKRAREYLDHDACQSISKRGWSVFQTVYQPLLASISTERVPLMRAETSSTSSSSPIQSEPRLLFTEKYGRCLEILHYGSNGTLRLHLDKTATQENKTKLLAIKVYRSNILDPSKPLPHAFSCSQASIGDIHPCHPNILSISEILHNEHSELCLVMPYCAGGDLHELLSRTGALPTAEADCLIAQILRALAFLHKNDTAHGDLRLETILLTARGSVKLAGLGDSHVRRIWQKCAMPRTVGEGEMSPSRGRNSSSQHQSSWSLTWLLSPFLRPFQLSRATEQFARPSASFVGINLPYIPPEGYNLRSHAPLCRETHAASNADYDPRPADVWATAIIYLVLITGRLPWRSACPHGEDPQYQDYLKLRRTEDGYPPIEALGHRRRNAVYAMLHPNPRRRITTIQMLRSEWMNRVIICEAGQMGY